jgi:hypothetical protein
MSFEQSVEDATRRFIDVIEDTRPGVIAIVLLAILASLVGAVGIDNFKQLKYVSLMTIARSGSPSNLSRPYPENHDHLRSSTSQTRPMEKLLSNDHSHAGMIHGGHVRKTSSTKYDRVENLTRTKYQSMMQKSS